MVSQSALLNRKDIGLFLGSFLVAATAMVSIAAAPRHPVVPAATVASVNPLPVQSARVHSAAGAAMRAMAAF